jgi:ABC-type lipoprotein release transport system permease subunit
MKELFDSQVRPFRSPDVRNLTRVRWLPNTLAAVLATLGLATLGHSLFAAVRRRSRDLALLKTLGFDRAQVARTVRWQAATSVVVATVIGLPVGVAAGRWVWRLVGERVGVVPEPVTPWLLVLALAPALLTLAVVVSAVPARIAASTSPARVLRAE